MKQVLITDHDLYYLRSIKRQLDSIIESIEFGPTLVTEVMADNRDWLDEFINKISKPDTE